MRVPGKTGMSIGRPAHARAPYRRRRRATRKQRPRLKAVPPNGGVTSPLSPPREWGTCLLLIKDVDWTGQPVSVLRRSRSKGDFAVEYLVENGTSITDFGAVKFRARVRMLAL